MDRAPLAVGNRHCRYLLGEKPNIWWVTAHANTVIYRGQFQRTIGLLLKAFWCPVHILMALLSGNQLVARLLLRSVISSPQASSLWKRSSRSFLRGARGGPGCTNNRPRWREYLNGIHRVVNLTHPLTHWLAEGCFFLSIMTLPIYICFLWICPISI